MHRIDRVVVFSEISLASSEDDAIALDAAPAIVTNISVWSHFVVAQRVNCAWRSSHLTSFFSSVLVSRSVRMKCSLVSRNLGSISRGKGLCSSGLKSEMTVRYCSSILVCFACHKCVSCVWDCCVDISLLDDAKKIPSLVVFRVRKGWSQDCDERDRMENFLCCVFLKILIKHF